LFGIRIEILSEQNILPGNKRVQKRNKMTAEHPRYAHVCYMAFSGSTDGFHNKTPHTIISTSAEGSP
jgi:hypothetical protein